MTILVSGGAGYIGSHMVLNLVGAGEEVVVLDNLSTGFRWAIAPQAKFIQGDIGDQELVSDIMMSHDIEAVIHFAGSIVVPDSITNPLGYYHNNTVNTRALLEQAVKHNVSHFIFSSTAAVYGTPQANPIYEDAALSPISPYGTSKMMSEIMLADSAKAHDITYVALRYFNVAGADPKGRSGQSTPQATHLIKVANQAALGERSHLEVYGTDYPTPDGTCVRDYIHVTDLATAHNKALAYLRAGGQSNVFNCGYGRGSSVFDVIETVKRISQTDFEVKLAPRRAGDPAALVAGADRIRDILHWAPEHDDLDHIVKTALNWERRLKELQGEDQPADKIRRIAS